MSTEWRAYVRVDEAGQVVLELDDDAYAGFWETLKAQNAAVDLTGRGVHVSAPVVVKVRSDETTLPGVKR